MNQLTCDLSYQTRLEIDRLADWHHCDTRKFDMWKIAISYARGTGKDFVTCRLVEYLTYTWMSWRYCKIWLLVLSATINSWDRAQSIKGFATLKNVINLQFASEVRLGDFTSYMLSWIKFGGQKWLCITIRVITGDYCRKSDLNEEDQGNGMVVCFACRRCDSDWAID